MNMLLSCNSHKCSGFEYGVLYFDGFDNILLVEISFLI